MPGDSCVSHCLSLYLLSPCFCLQVGTKGLHTFMLSRVNQGCPIVVVGSMASCRSAVEWLNLNASSVEFHKYPINLYVPSTILANYRREGRQIMIFTTAPLQFTVCACVCYPCHPCLPECTPLFALFHGP